jgi:hypothetical protein
LGERIEDDLALCGDHGPLRVYSRRVRAGCRLVAVVFIVGAMLSGCRGDDDGAGSAGEVSSSNASTPASDPTAPSPTVRCEPRTVTAGTVAAGVNEQPSLPSDAGELVAAVAATFCVPSWTRPGPDGTEQVFSPRPVLPADEARCIGDALVGDLGAARVREMVGLGSGPWHLLGFALANNLAPRSLDRAEAGVISDAFRDCATGWKLLLVLTITEGADQISDESASCVSEQLPDEQAHTILVGEIDRAYDDPAQADATAFSDLVAPLIQVLDRCLSPDEQARLDFD